MKKKVLFYGGFALVFAGAVSLTAMESTQVADVVNVASSDNSSESGASYIELPQKPVSEVIRENELITED